MTRNKLEAARDEIERLERLVGDLENSAEHTVVRDRVREEEMSALEEKVDKWEQRNRVLVARHLRLQEDHEVLIEQSKKNAVSPAGMQKIAHS
jgi:polyhydroxyalkanoate synthesis regulator phasin